MDFLDIAVLVATVATAVFTGWAVWQRWRYTARPLWVQPILSDVLHQDSSDGTSSVLLVWSIENRGDAAAHDVHVDLDWGDGWYELRGASTAIVSPGDSVTAAREVPSTGRGEYLIERGAFERQPVLNWDPTRARIRWRQHPNLKRVKRVLVDLPGPARS